MSYHRTKQIQTFRAQAIDGKEFVIHVFQDIIEIRTNDGIEEVEGLKSMKTSDGRSVNFIEPGSYEIVGFPNIPISSKDPDAP
jgi:hypothetical protein